jgi:SpoIID/LytB domain
MILPRFLYNLIIVNLQIFRKKLENFLFGAYGLVFSFLFFLILFFYLFCTPSYSYSVWVVYKGKRIKLELEEYLQGVVAGEIPLKWEDEVLKAQAVVARSWTIYHIIRGKKEFLASQSDQVWLPLDEYRDFLGKVKKAVFETRGWVLTFPSGNIAPGFFHSTCGGSTESAYELWNSEQDPEIKNFIISVKCNKCYDSPHFFWRRKFKISDIQKILKKEDDPISERISKFFSFSYEHTSSGRVRKIFLNPGFYLGYNQIREVLGLPSNFFSFEIDDEDYILFFGRGFGHGVGMCQWGAKKLAEEGKTWREILLFYFPLLKLKKIY